MKSNNSNSTENSTSIQKPAWVSNLRPTDPFFGLEYFLELEIDAINSFLSDAEKQMVIKEGELTEKIEAWKEEMRANPEAPDAYDMYESEIINIGRIPKLLYNSIFNTAYSCFEQRMYEVCDICKKEYGIKISAKEIQGKDYIDQCKKYIEKIVDVDLSHLNTLWEALTIYRKLRNALVHADSEIYSKLKRSINKNINIAKEIRITEEICFDENTNSEDVKIYVKIVSPVFITDFNSLFYNYISKLTSEITQQKTHPINPA